MIKPSEVTLAARSWIGVRYLHQGRSRYGVDCWGLLYAVGADLKIIPPGFSAPSSYGRMTDSRMRTQMAKYCTLTEEPGDGVVALMHWPGAAFAGHIGILTANGNVIHAYSRSKKVVEHGFRGPWLKLLDSMWRLPGVDFG